MTARDIQHYGLATSTNVMLDEIFPNEAAANGCRARFDSATCDEQQADIPVLAPILSCCSTASFALSAVNSIPVVLGNIDYKYHVDSRVLGSGHHGFVRECTDRVTGQKYAVKSIRKSDRSIKPGGLACEIALLKEMKHRNIVHLADVFEDAEYVHLVTDLCTGGELFYRILEKSSDKENGSACFGEDEAAAVMYQILTAVSYMHKRGIVHRDLKPENILFESASEGSPIMIIDFGLSRKHDRRLDPPMSDVVGTPHYVAPEVLAKSYDNMCDLWSVGVVAYVLLCGYPPFNGADNGEVRTAIRRGRYRFPLAEWSGTGRKARDFVRCLLRRDPRKRMTAEEALNHPWMVQWMVNHCDGDMAQSYENRRENSFMEVVFKGLVS